MQVHTTDFSAPLIFNASAALNDTISKPLFNTCMTNDEVRRYRLGLLIEEFGGVGKLATALEKSSSQVSQWRNASPDSKTGKRRAMNDDTARYIEKRAGKARGWLDIPPEAILAPDNQSPPNMPLPAETTRGCSPLRGIGRMTSVKVALNALTTELEANPPDADTEQRLVQELKLQVEWLKAVRRK